MKQKELPDEKVSLLEIGGSSIVKHKPIFSQDTKYLICPCGNVIKVYSLATGYSCRRLVGHTNEVTGVKLHPKNNLQILSSSLDGDVRVWDFEDGVSLLTFKLGLPLLGLFTHRSSIPVVYVAKQQGKKVELHKFFLNKKSNEGDDVQTELVAKNLSQNPAQLIDFSEKFFVVCSEQKVVVHQGSGESKFKRTRHIMNNNDSAVTCVSCHPCDTSFSTGHQSGEIRLWYNIFDTDSVVVNTQHWHSLDVLALAFTPRGSTILSGGQECVLVQWQEDGKHFLPRLGSPIQGIAVSDDNVLYACCHADNSISIITSFFTIRQTIEGFAATGSDLPCGLRYDEGSGAVVTNGKPGHLLFYSPATDTQLYNLDIVGRNFISSADLQRPLSRTLITKVDLCKTSRGHVMATLEFDRKSSRDQKLKFWNFSEAEQQWVLNTLVKSPHNEQEVTSLCFRPSACCCVTTGEDGCCKVWIMDEKSWICDRSITYRKSACKSAAFSQDGSLLAIAFAKSVVLCGCDDVSDLLPLTSHSEDIRNVQFGRAQCSHYLLLTTRSNVQSWNILTGALHWSIDLTVTLLVPDLFSARMAIFTATEKVFIFTPDRNLPVFAAKLDCHPVAASFFPSKVGMLSWSDASELYIVSDQMTVHKFWPENLITKAQLPDQAVPDVSSQTAGLSVFSKTAELAEDKIHKTTVQRTTVQDALSLILETPSHVLPSVTKLCDQFVTTLLLDGGRAPVREDDQSDARHGDDEPEREESMEVVNHQEPVGRVQEPSNFEYLVPMFSTLYTTSG